jgi:hypothetical protein
MRTEAGEKRPVARLAEIHRRAGRDAAEQVGQVAASPVMKTFRFPEQDVEYLANEYEACGVVQLW